MPVYASGRLFKQRISWSDLALAPIPIRQFSSLKTAQVRELKEFLFKDMYRHYRVVRMGDKAGRILRDLFASYTAEPLQLPPRYQERIPRDGLHRVVCDYIAGMTDRFALDEHRKLFDPLVKV